MNFNRIYILPITSKLDFSLSFIGIFFYLSIVILFSFYYNCLFLIKEEIFSYILLKSLFSIIESFIECDSFRLVFAYIANIILFSLLIFHLNRCLTQKKIVDDTSDLEINDKIYIILIFTLCLFPFDSFFNLQILEMIMQNIIKIALIFMLHKYIDKKIKIMIERLNQQQVKLKVEQNNNLESNENYYIDMLKSINSMHSAGAVLFIFCFSIKLYASYYPNNITDGISYFIRDGAVFFIILAQLLFFYCSNKIQIENSFKRNKFNDTIKKLKIIKIFNQDDADESSDFY